METSRKDSLKKRQQQAAEKLPEGYDLKDYDWNDEAEKWEVKPGSDSEALHLNMSDHLKESEFGDLFSRAKESDFREVTGKYLNFDDWKKRESRIYVFTGMTHFNNTETGEPVPAVTLKDEQGDQYICAATVLVGSLSNQTPPKACKIEFLGKPQGKKYNALKVYVA